MRLTLNGNQWYASWRDQKTKELRFVMEDTAARAISVGLFCAMGIQERDYETV